MMVICNKYNLLLKTQDYFFHDRDIRIFDWNQLKSIKQFKRKSDKNLICI